MVNYIDKLRIVATLMVFSLHSLLFMGKNYPMIDVIRESVWTIVFYMPAWGGVWIFFALSGYLSGIGFVYGRYDISLGGGKEILYSKIKKDLYSYSDVYRDVYSIGTAIFFNK